MCLIVLASLLKLHSAEQGFFQLPLRTLFRTVASTEYTVLPLLHTHDEHDYNMKFNFINLINARKSKYVASNAITICPHFTTSAPKR